jgi:hypothetical protein
MLASVLNNGGILAELNVFNLLKTKCRPLYLEAQFVPRCKHFSTRLQKTNQFIIEVAQVAVCSQVNTKHINTVWAEQTILELVHCWCIA